MAFQRPFLISLRRPNPQVPWGFRLVGGSFAQPQHIVQQVTEGGQAEKAGLHEGDEVIQIGRVNVQSLAHQDVQEVVLRCKDRIEIFVIREDLLRGRKENEPPTVKAVVHSNYNSPFQLYSTENVADTLALQTTVLTNPEPKFNHLGPQSPPVVLQSDVLKFLKEEEGRGYYVNGDIHPPPPTRKKQAPPSPPKPSVRFQEPLVVSHPGDKTEQQTSYETRSQSYQTTQKTVRQVQQTHQSNHQQIDSQQFKSQVSFQPQSPQAGQQQRIPLQSQENRVQSQSQEYQQRRYEEQQRIQQQDQYRQQELEQQRQEQILRRQEQIRQQQIAQQQEQLRQQQLAQQHEQLRQQHIAQQQDQQRQAQLSQQRAQQQQFQQQQQLSRDQEQTNRAKSGPTHPGATPTVRTKPSFDKFVGANNMKYTSTARCGPPSSPESPHRRGIAPPVWPPKNSSVRDLPKTGFSPGYIQDKCSKKFTWPPPKNDEYDPFNRTPTPTGTVHNAWHPADSEPPKSLPFAHSPTPTRRSKDIMWPPPHTQAKESPRHSPRVVRRGTGCFDDYIQQHASISLPPTYRTPPGTQHVEIVYEDE